MMYLKIIKTNINYTNNSHKIKHMEPRDDL